jgi:hypothetical protein
MTNLLKQANKLVLIIDNGLEIGLIANTAAVLALSVGARHPELIGADLLDGSGQIHIGITNITIPVLGADEAFLTNLAQRLAGTEIELVSFSKIAQSIHSYEEYSRVLNQTVGANILYSGLAIYGPKKAIDSLTGSLPRLK